jgi:hypothetical protein
VVEIVASVVATYKFGKIWGRVERNLSAAARFPNYPHDLLSGPSPGGGGGPPPAHFSQLQLLKLQSFQQLHNASQLL